MASKCRKVDRVLLQGQTMDLYSIDLDILCLTVQDAISDDTTTWTARQRFRCRQWLENEKSALMRDEVEIADNFENDLSISAMRFRYTVEFANVFNMGLMN